MMLKEVFQKKFEYGGIKFDEKYIYFQENETTVCKANIDDFTLVEEYHFEGDFSFNWVDDILLIKKHQYEDDDEEEFVHVYSLTDHKEILNGDLFIFDFYNYVDYFFVMGRHYLYRYDKKSGEVAKMDFNSDLICLCTRIENLFVCKDFHNVYIYEMKDDKMNVILRIKIGNGSHSYCPNHNSYDLWRCSS